MFHSHDILLSQSQAEAKACEALLGGLQPGEPPPAVGALPLRWAKSADTWHNVAGHNSYVDAYPCADRDGTSPAGTSIRVYLPRAPERDPNVVVNQVIGYVLDATGAVIAAAGYLDDAIGTVKLWSKTGDLPAGWVECKPGSGASATTENLAGTFPVGFKGGDSDFGTLGAHGNDDRKTHAHPMWRDQSNPPATPVWFDEGTYLTISVGNDLVNHLPPWCVVRFIERIDNSA